MRLRLKILLLGLFPPIPIFELNSVLEFLETDGDKAGHFNFKESSVYYFMGNKKVEILE